MTPETIKIARDGRGVATITMARPSVSNSLNQQLIGELIEAFETLDKDNDVRVFVLRAEGKNFCGGMDLSSSGNDTGKRRSSHDVLDAMKHATKPIIGIVQGAAAGAGAALVCCCDIVIAMDTAFVSIPESKLGIMPLPLMPLFDATLGPRQARRYLLTSEKILAAKAEKMGLFHEVVTVETLDATLGGILDGLLLGSPVVTKGMKTIWQKETLPVYAAPEGIDLNADRSEGVAAFKERRPPSWYRAPSKS